MSEQAFRPSVPLEPPTEPPTEPSTEPPTESERVPEKRISEPGAPDPAVSELSDAGEAAAAGRKPRLTAAPADLGPDPARALAVSFGGLLVMAFGGATDRHFVFDFGVLFAVGGALVFLFCVFFTRYKQQKAGRDGAA